MGNDKTAKWDSVKRYKLTKMINELSSIAGHGTELVTVYVPPRRPIFDVIGQLRNEAGTASNIKSDLTRSHVRRYVKIKNRIDEQQLVKHVEQDPKAYRYRSRKGHVCLA